MKLKVFKNPEGREILNLKKEFGVYLQKTNSDQILSKLLNISNTLPIGGELIIDFEGVKLLSPSLVFDLINDIVVITPKREKGLFRGRFLVAKDPNEDVLEILCLCLRKKHASLVVVYSDPDNPKKIIREEILNLPSYLKETLDIISQKGPISSHEVAKLLGEKKGTSAKERLRQLYRRGLVKREATGTIEGGRFFLYRKFSLIEVSPSGTGIENEVIKR